MLKELFVDNCNANSIVKFSFVSSRLMDQTACLVLFCLLIVWRKIKFL